ncbi:acriflavin resistance protein [Novimethylophilus kurashikiensis]|uniref:Acriflavin resistance protein n=1 Tax=Novimethylophilus kurashikiensis TaxID=1825523 RepID=A0A2R5F632_9PROT|nr:hypothetical protein [Novimethylophilus kurashikiensis]GBG13359.1 acriflavin resistance protein [Novimethylophilus kurashikiensis]
METFIIARVLHVLGVVLWIGGVGMVTMVLLPAVKAFRSEAERVEFFEAVESRFARQARIYTLITGLSGFYMLYVLNAWDRYLDAQFWWVHAMTATWAIFTLMLFVLEPLVLHRKLAQSARTAPRKTLTAIIVMHWLLLTMSLVTVAGAVAGSHGWSFQ